jgi:chemotaxis protein CheX
MFLIKGGDYMSVSVELINPFISAAQSVLRDLAQINTKMGKPYLKKPEYEGQVVSIIVGITGELRGQVILTLDERTACDIASHMMMGMPVPELNDMSRSAVSELSNMILGNAATIFSTKGITVDITPPNLCVGSNMSFTVSDSKTICVPIDREDGSSLMELNIAMKK